MEACYRIVVAWAAIASLGATYSTTNFVVHAPTDQLARSVGQAAEEYRKELAIEWTGREMPPWYRPCPIHVKVGTMGAGGATTFNFEGREVHGWRMSIQGSEERILDSVLPHEVNHTIFACHFRRPMPRWADEGAASLIEHDSERYRLRKIAEQALRNGSQIPIRKLLAMKEYPSDSQAVLTLYAQGHAIADYLVQQGGKPRYLEFLAAAHASNWDEAFRKFYGVNQLDEFESRIGEWVLAGSPPLDPAQPVQLAASRQPSARSAKARTVEPTVRGQSPDEPEIALAPAAAKPAAGPMGELSRVPLEFPVLRRLIQRGDGPVDFENSIPRR